MSTTSAYRHKVKHWLVKNHGWPLPRAKAVIFNCIEEIKTLQAAGLQTHEVARLIVKEYGGTD